MRFPFAEMDRLPRAVQELLYEHLHEQGDKLSLALVLWHTDRLPADMVEELVADALCTDDLYLAKAFADGFGSRQQFSRVVQDVTGRALASAFAPAHENYLLGFAAEVKKIRILTWLLLLSPAKERASLRALRFLVGTGRLVLWDATAGSGAVTCQRARADHVMDAEHFMTSAYTCLRNGRGRLLNEMITTCFVDIQQIRDKLVMESPTIDEDDVLQTIAHIAAETWQTITLEIALSLGARADPAMLVNATKPCELYPYFGAQDHVRAVRSRAGGVLAGRRVVDILLRQEGVGPDAWKIVAEREMQAHGLSDLIIWTRVVQ